MELSDNDRQRIEQEAIIYTDGHGSTHKNWRGFLKGAEYATLYERDKRKLWNDENNNLIKELGRRDGRIQQLEAERSEVRNKVIEEAVSKFEQAIKEINPHAYGSAYESVTLNKVIDFLNSLKTK